MTEGQTDPQDRSVTVVSEREKTSAAASRSGVKTDPRPVLEHRSHTLHSELAPQVPPTLTEDAFLHPFIFSNQQPITLLLSLSIQSRDSAVLFAPPQLDPPLSITQQGHDADV